MLHVRRHLHFIQINVETLFCESHKCFHLYFGVHFYQSHNALQNYNTKTKHVKEYILRVSDNKYKIQVYSLCIHLNFITIN